MFADCLCALQDPSIKQMAEQIAQDPAFAQMAQAMQGGGGMPPGKLHADICGQTLQHHLAGVFCSHEPRFLIAKCVSRGAVVAVGMMPPGFPGTPGAAAAGVSTAAFLASVAPAAAGAGAAAGAALTSGRLDAVDGAVLGTGTAAEGIGAVADATGVGAVEAAAAADGSGYPVYCP